MIWESGVPSQPPLNTEENIFIYIIKLDIRKYIYIHMLPIAGQTAGPIWLKLFVDTHECPGVVMGKKKFQRATPGPSASI